jgi:hypothetical protein
MQLSIVPLPQWFSVKGLMMAVTVALGIAMLKGGVTGTGIVLPERARTLDRVLHVIGGIILMVMGVGGFYVGFIGRR